MFEGIIASKFADKYFEKDTFKIVKKHARLGALLMMFPDLGLGGFFYIAVLWRMYSKISDKVGISFRENMGKLIGVGAFVNIAVAFFLDFALSTLFFIEPFFIYAQFYLSGKFFIESLKKFS